MTPRAPSHGRPKLVVLDNDAAVLRAVGDLLDPWFEVLETKDARRALTWVQQYAAVRVIVTERFTSSVAGLSVLEAVRTLRPDVRRVMLTDHADLSGLVDQEPV